MAPAAAVPTPLPTPDNHPLFQKAQEYFDQKKYKEAKQILNQLVAKASPLEDYIPRARLLLANLQDDFTVSISQFKSLAAEYASRPEGEEAQKDLGARYYLADKYQEAVQSYEDFIRDYPKSSSLAEVRYWYATALSAEGKNEEAVDQYRKALDKAPDGPWAPKALLGMGNAYFKLKKYKDAEKQYLRILDRYHDYEELNLVYFRLGQTYELEGKPTEAHAAYQTLVGQYPRSLETKDAKARMTDLEQAHPNLAPPPAPEVPREPTPTPLPEPTPAAAAMGTPTPEAEEVILLEPEQVLKTKPFHVQVGVYSQKANADKARAKVRKAGYASFVVTVRPEGVPYPVYKVRVGHFPSRLSAERVAKILSGRLKEKVIVVED